MHLDDVTKNKILYSCLFALMIGNMMLDNVYATLPKYIAERNTKDNWSIPGYDFTEVRYTFILVMFSIAQLLFAPFTASFKNKIGSKNTILLGFLTMTMTTIGLGMMTYIDDPVLFFVVGNILRFVQGMGDVWLQFTAYSVITTLFSYDIMRYIKYIEIAVGLGLGLGPFTGDELYERTDDFALSMYVFGGLNFVTLLICAILIPNELNMTASQQEIDAVEDRVRTLSNIENLTKREKIGWKLMFTNKHSFFAILVALVGTFDIMYFKGFLSLELEERDYGHYAGMIMAFPAFTYLASCLLLPYTCEHTSRKFLFVIAMFGFAGTMFMLGPSEVLHFPNNVWLIIMSQPPMGILQVFVFIPIIPEMLERLQVDLDIAEGESEEVDMALNDQVNECYTLLYAFANGVSPLIGGFLHDHYGSEKTCDWVAFVNIGVGVISLLFNCGIFVFREDRAFKNKLESLRAKGEKYKQ